MKSKLEGSRGGRQVSKDSKMSLKADKDIDRGRRVMVV